MPLWKLLTTFIAFVRSYIILHPHNTPKGGQKVYGQGRSMLDWSNSGARVLAIRKDPRIHQQACFAFSKPVPNTQKTDLRVTIIHLLAKSIELQACSFFSMRLHFHEPMPPLTFQFLLKNFHQLWVKFLLWSTCCPRH